MKAQFTMLYKANRHKMNPEERKEFVRELQRVIDSKTELTNYVIDSVEITTAFFWGETPQGSIYWIGWQIKFKEQRFTTWEQ